MTDTSRIDKLVDAAAYVGSLVPGVKSVWGCGASGLVFPFNAVVPDGVIKAFPGDPVEPYTHLSDLPSASFTAHSATWTDIVWTIPQVLFLDANDPQNARRIGIGFPALYMAAFAAHAQLLSSVSGFVNAALLQNLSWTEEAGTWFAMRMTLQAIERLNLNYQPA